MSLAGIKDAKHKRMRVMMENAATFSDVEFRVGPDGGTSFLGLKAIFARASEVFSKMFFEAGFREQVLEPRPIVHIPDLQPASFEQLHRWVYDVDVLLTCETVFGVLEAARKYMVEDLELHCRRWIAAKSRSPDGAIGLYASAAEGWPDWACRLQGRVESLGTAVLVSPTLHQLSFDALATLLGSPDFSATSEVDIFEAAKAWADAADRRDEDPAAAWQQVVDGEVVRWHNMDMRFFAEHVVIPALLTQERALAVFLSISLGNALPREASLLGRLRGVLCGACAEEAPSRIKALVELCAEDGYPRALAQSLVERTLADHACCGEWVEMWSELWGALRVAGFCDECVRATVDYCQNLFEDDPAPDSLVGVWICPSDTLGLVRILCKLNDHRKLAVLPLIKVLEVLVSRAEEGTHLVCAPEVAARALVLHLDEVAARQVHLVALQNLPALRTRLSAVCVGGGGMLPDRECLLEDFKLEGTE
eukprot:gnl/TRDRNA2_/TRDRNA2_30371_c0_seq1.p1 gnl/TRDRNA2_/TRDRNA2_30371_c0~~gnl/TRDRNA2_/TRDRNA2_30371_c0_seq1.p1  ORF type:complete len:479 (+),score=93.36 gnl/TRDRNA2_/TRDRNA2_30371_c0_seq1:82-1518(+)